MRDTDIFTVQFVAALAAGISAFIPSAFYPTFTRSPAIPHRVEPRFMQQRNVLPR
jgi:hypothetical protein